MCGKVGSVGSECLVRGEAGIADTWGDRASADSAWKLAKPRVAASGAAEEAGGAGAGAGTAEEEGAGAARFSELFSGARRKLEDMETIKSSGDQIVERTRCIELDFVFETWRGGEIGEIGAVVPWDSTRLRIPGFP